MSAHSPEVRKHVGRYAALTRSRTPDDPELVATRRKLNEERIAAYVRRVLADGPPLTDAQRARLADLLMSPTGNLA